MTLYTLLLATTTLLLSRHSGQDDIIIGIPVANREHPGTGGLIGFFVNSLPLRIQVEDILFSEYLEHTHQNIIEAQAHQGLPFERMIDELEVERDTSRHPLFQVMLNLEQASTNTLDTVALDYAISKFDLDINFTITENSIEGEIAYAKSLFKAETIERLSAYLERLLTQIADVDQKTHAYALLSKEEYQTVIYDWNQTEHPFPESTLHELFTKQAKATPNNTALVYEGQTLTYQELDAQSNQLARRIQAHHPSPLITLCLERSLEMVIAILATLKAGCAYVPMDPEAPLARIRHMLADTKTNLVLTQSFIKHDFNVTRIDLDQHSYQDQSKERLKNHTTPQDLAYVIYTSGTTGLPKGVMVEHQHIKRLFDATESIYQFSDNDVWTMFHAYVFDFSVWELWGALLYGARCLIPKKEDTRDAHQFYQLCCAQGVTILNQTPLAFEAFSQFVDEHHQLRHIIFGGDTLQSKHIETWFEKNKKDTKLINMYGITETTVHVTLHEINPNAFKSSYIGRPLADLKAYILDPSLNPLPIGAIGELYIGGAGVARGYLNQEKLTEERFIQNPFAEGRLYKTGDLVRYLADGNIEYIGRNDLQVKIRGFRIELGEIETRLAQYPDITQVSVQYYAEPKPILAAYYVSPTPITDADLQAYLASSLPDYMVPNSFTHLGKLPLTVNGKLDRKALPIPTFKTQIYVAPRNELEDSITHIWQELLQVEKVGIEDDFFKLGGNSILAIQLIYRLKDKLSIHFQVADIFKYKTIGALLKSFNYGQSESQLFHKLTSNQDVGQTIYLLHPGFAHSSDSYHAFVEKADGLVNLFGFEHYFLKDESIKIATFEEWARYYVSFMQHHLDKSKEMIFLGWSLGGNLAIEMAHLLEAQGYENIKLYLLDTMVQKAPKDGQLLSRLAIKHEIIKSLGKDYCFNIPKEAMNKMIDFGVFFNNIMLSTIHPRVLKKSKGVLFRADKDKKGCSNDNGLQCFFENRLQIFQIEESHHAIMNASDEIWDKIIQINNE